jgi:hypothetical protein
MFPRFPGRRLLLSSILMLSCVIAFAELSDPTRPTKPTGTLFSDSGGEGTMQLKAILYSAGNPVIVIGDNILHRNDSIGGYTVTQIYPQSVELTSKKGEKFNLNLDTLEVKKPHI